MKQHDIQNLKDEELQFWADYEIGSSGLSISIQRHLKSMAPELLKSRAEHRECVVYPDW